MADKKNIFTEFKDFISRGNVLDMAVGVIIGGAFTAIVSSVTNDLLSPILGLITGDSLAELAFTVNLPWGDGVTFTYGAFLTAVINFFLTALVLFLIIKGIKAVSENAKKLGKKKAEEAPAEPTEKECPYCMMMIPIKATRCGHCTSELNK